MTLKQLSRLLVSVAMLTPGAVNVARAAVIQSVGSFSTPGFSTGTLGPVGNTPAPNNDDALGASPNVIPYSVFFNSPGALETEFVLGNSGGTTEYRFTQTFLKTREGSWSGFRFELGFGLGANFVLSQNADNLQFDSFEGHSTATSTPFLLQVDEFKTLEWGDGLVQPFQAAIFTFAIDVPDDLASANPAGLNRFTLRQTPIEAAAIPEPGTFGLLGAALCGVTIRVRRARS